MIAPNPCRDRLGSGHPPIGVSGYPVYIGLLAHEKSPIPSHGSRLNTRPRDGTPYYDPASRTRGSHTPIVALKTIAPPHPTVRRNSSVGRVPRNSLRYSTTPHDLWTGAQSAPPPSAGLNSTFSIHQGPRRGGSSATLSKHAARSEHAVRERHRDQGKSAR